MSADSSVVHLLAPNPSAWTGSGTNTYIVTSRARSCVVVDPGTDNEAHLSAIERAVLSRGTLTAILVTHGHPDHVGGVELLRRSTGAPVMMSKSTDVSFVDARLDDGALVNVGERRIRALHTPGHRFDHMCFYLEDDALLIAGDMLAGSGTVVVAPPDGDMTAYLDSLRRMQAFELRRILPGHGPPINDPSVRLEDYLRHRLEREQQVVAGLAAGDDTVAALVDRIYRDLDPSLRPAAALSISAHLIKLERERKAIHDVEDGTWRPAS